MPATELDKTPVRGEMSEDEEGLYPDESRSLENLWHMRLIALLQDMIDSETEGKMAKALGISSRTVSRAVESGQLTPRMSAELERHLLPRGGSAAVQQRESIGALEERVSLLEERLGSGLEGLGVVEEAFWRPYRDVVTAEPEPGEDQIYGDATSSIIEWRRAQFS